MAAPKKSAAKKAKSKTAKKTSASAKPKTSSAKARRDMDEVVFEARDLKIHAVRDDGSELPIVKGVDFKVRRGEVVALIGESGSGKTTISLSALGYCKPGLKFAGGQALLLGEDVTQKNTEELRPIRGEKVAYLAQSAAATFNPSILINEQVTEAPVQHGTKTREEADAKALALYHALELPNPETIGNRYPHQVSGGQLQRLMAAMALCGEPDLLVLDEPTTALDVTTQIEVLKAFKSVIKDEGAAAIYVTHDLAVVAQIADHIVVLYNGEIKEAGPVDVIINQPKHPYTKRLMAAIKPLPEAGQSEGSSDEHMRDVPALEVKDIDAGYGRNADGSPKVMVLKDVNVSIERGKTVGIIGESGCGKSTLARVFAGLLPPMEGEILLDGERLAPDLRQRSRDELQKIQFVYQMADTALNPRHRIRDILGRPVEFYSGLRGKAKQDRINELLEMVELPLVFADRYPHELSGGQKQRVNLARALAADPEVVLCDEVTSALDTIVGANVIELLKSLREKTGVSYVFISHDLSTVASFADEIVVLYAGRVAEQGPTDQVLSPPYHPYTRLLVSSVPEPRVGWLEDTMKRQESASGIAGQVNLTAVGCPFFDRCPLAIPGTCDTTNPPRRVDKNKHVIECHRELTELGG
jgi:peptide/nickel transport system ATP-binding protein